MKRIQHPNGKYQTWYGWHPGGKPKYYEVKDMGGKVVPRKKPQVVLWRWSPQGNICEYRTTNQWVRWGDGRILYNLILRKQRYPPRREWEELSTSYFVIFDIPDKCRRLAEKMKAYRNRVMKSKDGNIAISD